MNKTKITFFGTHQFAVTILQALIDAPFIEVAHVVTQPDEPVGRKQVLTPPPVKILADKYNIPVAQPASLKTFEFGPLTTDLNVVAQYGRIIPKSIIEAPQFRTLNVHTSLLPKYRGASPIQFALWHGETETGVTIMQMDEGMDTGPILLQKKIDILKDETYLELDARLAETGAKALLEALPQYIGGTLQGQPQTNAEATLTTLLTREDGRVDWKKSAQEVYNQYRGLTPWPGLWTMWGEKRLKLTDVRPSDVAGLPGQVISQSGKLYIGCTTGSVEIRTLQLEGKTAVDAKAFLSGYQNFVGDTLN